MYLTISVSSNYYFFKSESATRRLDKLNFVEGCIINGFPLKIFRSYRNGKTICGELISLSPQSMFFNHEAKRKCVVVYLFSLLGNTDKSLIARQCTSCSNVETEKTSLPSRFNPSRYQFSFLRNPGFCQACKS